MPLDKNDLKKWPITYEELSKYYNKVIKFLKIRNFNEKKIFRKQKINFNSKIYNQSYFQKINLKYFKSIFKLNKNIKKIFNASITK